jgi:ADP-heptose:LPS heptosyltransferase
MKLSKKIEIKGRKIILKILAKVIRNPKYSEIDKKQIKKIIIVRIDERLGNLVLTIPVINSFLKNGYDVTIIAGQKFSALLNTIKGLKIINFNKKKLFNPFYLFKYIYQLRKIEYDLLFDASNPNDLSVLTFFIILLIKSKYKIGFRRKESEVILNILIERPEKPVHILNYYKIIFDFLKIKFYKELKIDIPKNKRNLNEKLIAIHPGGRGNKRYPIENLLKFIKMLEKIKGYKFIVIIGPDEKDLEELFKDYKIVQPKDVLELMNYLNECEFYIGNDSGPMHLASALGLKVIAIFKKDASILFRPATKKYKILVSDDVSKIKPEEIFDAFKSLI